MIPRHWILRHVISLRAGWRAFPAGGTAWCRRFGRPMDLPGGERVVLVVEVAAARPGTTPGPPAIAFNGRPFADYPHAESRRGGAAVGGRSARDVTAFLEARNVLEIVPAPGGAGGGGVSEGHRPLPAAVAGVWLEIQAPSGGACPADRAPDDLP